MSRSNPTPTNPAEKRFSYSGSTGQMQFYDRDTKTMIEVPEPFTFLVLDELSTIGGYSDAHKSGIWANEVRSTKDQLTVRTGAGSIAIGPYDQIKDALKAQGGKYARSIYIAYQEGSDWKVGNIKLTGAGLGAWFDFKRKNNVESDAVRLEGSDTDKNGSVTYHIPKFYIEEIDDEAANRAIELDEQLQSYLKTALSARPEAPAGEPLAESEVQATADDGQNDIDLSEIPF